MAGNLPVTLKRVHVSKIHSAAGNLNRSQKNCARPNGIDIHMSIGSEFELLGGNGVFVRSADQGRAEIAGIVGIRHPNPGGGAQLAEERSEPGGETNQIVRSERQD